MFGRVTDFVTYYKVIKAIPWNWKILLKQNTASRSTLSVKVWVDEYRHTRLKLSHFCYQYVRDVQTIDNSALKTIWQHDLKQPTLTQKDFDSLFLKIDKITPSTKLRYFQYRILTKSLMTNVRVAKFDPAVTEYCSFCQSEKEMVVHLFWYCQKITKIWKMLKKWLQHFYDVKVTFAVDNVMLCNLSGRNSKLLNTFILITKFYIYRCKTQQVQLVLKDLIADITKYKSIEKTIAQKNDTLYKYARKWNDFSVFY